MLAYKMHLCTIIGVRFLWPRLITCYAGTISTLAKNMPLTCKYNPIEDKKLRLSELGHEFAHSSLCVYVPADVVPACSSDSVAVYCPCVRESKRQARDSTEHTHTGSWLRVCESICTANSLRHLPALLTMMDAAPVAASEVCPTKSVTGREAQER